MSERAFAWFELTEDNETKRHLAWSDSRHAGEKASGDNPHLATASEIAEFLDCDAENCNRHALAGVHRRTAEIMHSNGIKPLKIRLVMREIAMNGGMHSDSFVK